MPKHHWRSFVGPGRHVRLLSVPAGLFDCHLRLVERKGEERCRCVLLWLAQIPHLVAKAEYDEQLQVYQGYLFSSFYKMVIEPLLYSQSFPPEVESQ